MDRNRRGLFRLRLSIILLLAVCMFQAGCLDLITTSFYMLKGFQTPAAFPGLKEKTVAVVCRSPRSVNPDQEIAVRQVPARVNSLLSINGKKINVIDQRKIERWIDENGIDSFVDVGEALNAEMVVGIELEDYSLYRSSSIFQGNVRVRVKVYDMTDGNRLVFEAPVEQIKFPPAGGTATSEIARPEFNNMFVDVIAEKIGINFYDHDHTASFAGDSKVLR
ncbi:MAG: hypothetical protein MPJ50_12580 [Pirellulales bacterium]|nr:hypothetical protein [Pirellulales bacterium]